VKIFGLTFVIAQGLNNSLGHQQVNKRESTAVDDNASPKKRNLISMKSALERLGCRRTKAYELINHGIIKAFKMGHQTMVDRDSIDAYHSSLPSFEPRDLR